MIDTIKNIPTVKTYVNVLDIIINGYWQREKIDIGPYLYSYAYNNIEGHRPRLGLRTNARWHPRWLLQGYIAYGTKDKEFKYNAEINYIFSPKRWGVIGIQSNEDLDLLAIDRTDYGTQNLTNYFTNPTLFMVASRFGSLLGFGDLLRPYRHTIRRAWIGYDILPSVNQKFLFQNRTVIPLFDFGYYQQGKEQTAANLKDRFTVTEFVGETTIFIGATIGSYGNRRTLLGSKKPIVRFRYTLGLSGVLGGEIAYQKMEGSFEHNVRLGSLGRTRYKISVGYVPSLVPYPLLINHLGNNKPIYNKNAFNMMRSFEFVSDRFISLQLFHRFEGVFLNRIPLLRKISARAIATANIMYGSIRSKNLQSNLNATSAITGMNSVRPFSFIEKEPYVEVGYGVENLFKFIRVDFLHRINYLENKNENANLLDSRSTISRFSVKVLAQLNF